MVDAHQFLFSSFVDYDQILSLVLISFIFQSYIREQLEWCVLYILYAYIFIALDRNMYLLYNPRKHLVCW